MKRVIRGVVALLTVIGVAAALGRAVFVSDLVTRAEPARAEILGAIHDDPLLHSEEELRAFDGRYANHPLFTLLHVIPGALFLALAPLQFSATLRRRHPAVHRWSGRALLVIAVLTMIGAFFFAFVVPFGGSSETVTIACFGALFLFALARAFIAIRRKDVARHREWIIRAFSVALAISTIRIVGAAFDLAWMPTGPAVARMFVLSLWIGWLTTLAAAEGWIRYTRPLRVGGT